MEVGKEQLVDIFQNAHISISFYIDNNLLET
jgi:hypothetical protein